MKCLKFLMLLSCPIILLGCQNEATLKESLPQKKQDWAFTNFVKVDSLNPILTPSNELNFIDPLTNKSVRWEERNVLNPTAVVKDGKVFLMYRAQDSLGTSRIGMAVSEDGLHFNKMKSPVLFPDKDIMKIFEWNYKKDSAIAANPNDCISCYFDGIEDPRIVESSSGDYIMTYTAYDGKTARLSIASSKDLITWVKHGIVLNNDKYQDTWSKAGAIVGELVGNKIIAKKINGFYWMYFGDTNIFMARSVDLIKWEVIENAESEKRISVLHPRAGYFDSRLVEPGPYALYKKEGIVLIYNGSNSANYNDPTLPKFTYSAGQALFDKKNPHKQIDRMQNFFIHPDKDYEKIGEVNEVCFVEGLVYFKGKWFLYYGTGDSKIAVAVSDN